MNNINKLECVKKGGWKHKLAHIIGIQRNGYCFRLILSNSHQDIIDQYHKNEGGH